MRMLCLSVVSALQGFATKATDIQNLKIQQTLQREEEGYAALDHQLANVKKIQDSTAAEIAQMRKGDFFGPGLEPSSLAEIEPSKDVQQSKEQLDEVNAQVDAQLSTLDQQLKAREAAHKHGRSLLETGELPLPHTNHFHPSKVLEAMESDMAKTNALRDQMHQRASEAKEKFKEDMRRETEAESSLGPVDSAPPVDVHVPRHRHAEDADSLLEVGSKPTPVEKKATGPAKEHKEPIHDANFQDMKKRIEDLDAKMKQRRQMAHERLAHDQLALAEKRKKMEEAHAKFEKSRAKLDADFAHGEKTVKSEESKEAKEQVTVGIEPGKGLKALDHELEPPPTMSPRAPPAPKKWAADHGPAAKPAK